MEKEALALEVEKILIEECGLQSNSLLVENGMLQRYLLEMLDKDPRKANEEIRFCGALGLGGKLYFDGDSFYVGFYIEHTTEEREQMRDKANARLDALMPQR